MIERAAGYTDDCCMSFGNENFGKMVEIAGGTNIAGKIIPGTFGVVNPEQIIAANPDHVIVTGSNWELYVPGGAWVGVGSGADRAKARAKLAELMKRPAYTGVRRCGPGRSTPSGTSSTTAPTSSSPSSRSPSGCTRSCSGTSIPDQTMRTLYERFLPVDYKPGYWVSLNDKEYGASLVHDPRIHDGPGARGAASTAPSFAARSSCSSGSRLFLCFP